MSTELNASSPLRGPQIHVYKNDRLYLRQFFRPKRLLTATLRGQSLVVQYHYVNKTCTYDLCEAKLVTYSFSQKISIQLSNREKLCFFAHDAEEFQSWATALEDSINWNIERFYGFEEAIGEGAFATVVRGIHRDTEDVVAVKIISKNSCTEDEMRYLQREIDILKTLKHRNVVFMSDLFQSNNNLYIVLEYMAGGTLTSLVETGGPLSEWNARFIMKDILSGLQYLHSKNVVHRDIKPDNLLCTGTQFPTTVKLLDFGLSRTIKKDNDFDDTEDEASLGPDGLMTTPVGTPSFAAPEILSSMPYGREVDCFACGIVMYWMLCGYLPFCDPDPDALIDLIKRAEFEFPDKDWADVTNGAKSLITGLLDRSSYARLSATEALEHPWLTQDDAEADGNPVMSSSRKEFCKESEKSINGAADMHHVEGVRRVETLKNSYSPQNENIGVHRPYSDESQKKVQDGRSSSNV